MNVMIRKSSNPRNHNGKPYPVSKFNLYLVSITEAKNCRNTDLRKDKL